MNKTGVRPDASKAAGKKRSKAATASAVAQPIKRSSLCKTIAQLGPSQRGFKGLKRRVMASGDPAGLDPGVRTKTLRLRSYLDQGLEMLRPMLGVSANEMINEAVDEYIEKRTALVETDLGGLLEQVRAYRKADPDFKFARARVVAAEMEMSGKDPTDGTLFMEDPLPASPAASRARKHG